MTKQTKKYRREWNTRAKGEVQSDIRSVDDYMNITWSKSRPSFERLTPIFSESGFHEFPLTSIPERPIFSDTIRGPKFCDGLKDEEEDARQTPTTAVYSFMMTVV